MVIEAGVAERQIEQALTKVEERFAAGAFDEARAAARDAQRLARDHGCAVMLLGLDALLGFVPGDARPLSGADGITLGEQAA